MPPGPASPCFSYSPGGTPSSPRHIHRGTKRVLQVITLLTGLAWCVALAAVVFPEWSVEDAQSQSKLNAHIGLFETIYYVGTTQEPSTLRFCDGLSPMYSTQKCVLWKVAQIDALIGLSLAYTGLVLLLLIVGTHWLRPRKVEFLLSWVWSLLFMGGVCAMVSAGAWEMLVLAFLRDHEKLGDGYSVKMGWSMLAMGTVGAMLATLPFWRMLLHLCFVGRTRKSSNGVLPQSTAAAVVAAQQHRRKHYSSSSSSSRHHHHHHSSTSTARWQERTGDMLQLRKPTGDGLEELHAADGMVVIVEEQREVLTPLEGIGAEVTPKSSQ